MEFLRRQSKASLSIDTLEQYIESYREEVEKAFLMADIGFVDVKEQALIRRLKGKDLVIKKGSKGVEYIRNGTILNVEAPKVKKVVDKTGAGDILAGTFLTLLALGRDPEHALLEAVNLASKSVTGYGIDFLLKDYRS